MLAPERSYASLANRCALWRYLFFPCYTFATNSGRWQRGSFVPYRWLPSAKISPQTLVGYRARSGVVGYRARSEVCVNAHFVEDIRKQIVRRNKTGESIRQENNAGL